MKVLIWITSILIASFISSVIEIILSADGIVLGGIPSVIVFGGIAALAIYTARYLCKKWEKHKAAQVNAENLYNPQSLQPEYLGKGYICPICKLVMDAPIPCENCGYIPPKCR